jgi:hypothetical protein
MDNRIVREYRRIRKHGTPWMMVGENASAALSAARSRVAFRDLEADGLARIRVEADTDVDVSWMDECQLAEWDGTAYGTIAEYRLSEDDEWIDVDSCWGHIGYTDPSDPDENCYVDDHYRAIVEAVENAKIGAGI